MNKIFIILTLYLSFGFVKAQERIDSSDIYPEFRLGSRLESNRVKEERLADFYNKQPAYKSSFVPHSGYVFPLSVYLFLQCNINKRWVVEFRSGILFAGEHLTSVSFGFYGHYYIFERKGYLIFGIDNTSHIDPITFGADSELRDADYQTITAHNDNIFHSSLLLGVGLHLSKTFSIDLSISKPFKKEYGWHEIKDPSNRIDLPDGRYTMKLFYMVKFGLNIFIF